jgi:hypothetical protein
MFMLFVFALRLHSGRWLVETDRNMRGDARSDFCFALSLCEKKGGKAHDLLRAGKKLFFQDHAAVAASENECNFKPQGPSTTPTVRAPPVAGAFSPLPPRQSRARWVR